MTLDVDGRKMVILSGADDTGGGGLGLRLVERSPWRVFVRRLLMALSALGQYLAAVSWVRPGQVEWLPSLMDASQVDLTGNPTAAC